MNRTPGTVTRSAPSASTAKAGLAALGGGSYRTYRYAPLPISNSMFVTSRGLS